jgi:hypothetical protein
MTSQATVDLFARADSVNARAKIEIARTHELHGHAHKLLGQLHVGLRALREIEDKSHARLSGSRRQAGPAPANKITGAAVGSRHAFDVVLVAPYLA